MDTGTSVERQLYILSILSQSTRGYTISEIIEQLHHVGIDATRRMISRDMDSISHNFYVYEETHGNKTVFKADKYAVSKMDFSMPQIISLYYIKELLSQNQQLNIAREAVAIVDHILGQMPELSKAALYEIENMIKVVPDAMPQEKDLDEGILEQVRRAAAEKKRIVVEYTSFHAGETTERPFDPYVLEVREGCWHVIGHCHIRNSIRDLRVSRIKNVSSTKETFTLPQGFYENYKRTRFDKLAGEDVAAIQIEFTGHAARMVMEYHADMADRLEKQGDRLMFYKNAALTPDLVQWALGFGAQAKVLSPPALVEQMHREALQMAELYQNGEQ